MPPSPSGKRSASRSQDPPPKGWDAAPEYASYDEVPWFRKRWAFVLFWLLFTPALIVVAFSGDVYASVNGQVVKFKPANKMLFAVIGTMMIVFGLIRLFVLDR